MSVTIQLDDDLVRLMQPEPNHMDPEEIAREMIVTEMYRRQFISSGKAAELLGMSRVAFLDYAAQLGIPYFTITAEELEAELAQFRSQ